MNQSRSYSICLSSNLINRVGSSFSSPSQLCSKDRSPITIRALTSDWKSNGYSGILVFGSHPHWWKQILLGQSRGFKLIPQLGTWKHGVGLWVQAQMGSRNSVHRTTWVVCLPFRPGRRRRRRWQWVEPRRKVSRPHHKFGFVPYGALDIKFSRKNCQSFLPKKPSKWSLLAPVEALQPLLNTHWSTIGAPPKKSHCF